jgi:hypothetical protein
VFPSSEVMCSPVAGSDVIPSSGSYVDFLRSYEAAT